MWYCVIHFPTLRVLYHGIDEQAAKNASTPQTYTAIADRYGPALSKAAMAAGYLRRGVPVPGFGPRERDEE